MGGAGGFSQGMKKTSTQMPTLFPFILNLLNDIKLNLILSIKYSPNGLFKFTSVCRILPKYGILVVRFNKKHLDNFGSERFFKNPLGECSLYHSWTLLSKHHYYRGASPRTQKSLIANKHTYIVHTHSYKQTNYTYYLVDGGDQHTDDCKH